MMRVHTDGGQYECGQIYPSHDAAKLIVFRVGFGSKADRSSSWKADTRADPAPPLTAQIGMPASAVAGPAGFFL